MTAQIRVLIVDDDALVRAGLTMLLAAASDSEIVGEAADGGVVKVGMVTAVAADDLIRVGVATFRPTLHDAGRLAAENHRPAVLAPGPGHAQTGLESAPPTTRAPVHPGCGDR
jgi:hypothetical protein